MVIGSGPGGLEAARVAAIRGHEVHIFEKEDKITLFKHLKQLDYASETP